MQNRITVAALPTFLFIVLLGFSTEKISAQQETGLIRQSSPVEKSDSLYKQTALACEDPIESLKPETWLKRAKVLGSILDEPTLSIRHTNTDLRVDLANALLKLISTDSKKEHILYSEPSLAGVCIDLTNSGLQSLENARVYKSAEDAGIGAALLGKSMECYIQTGNSQYVVDNEWIKNGLSWEWIKFYQGVGLRKSGETEKAMKIFTSLMSSNWRQPKVYMEAADLANQLEKSGESITILNNGFKLFPNNTELACALVQNYLMVNKTKEAKSLLRKLEKNPENEQNLDFVFTEGSYFEKKGDYKRAEGFFRAWYMADKNEVNVIQFFAAFLIRKTDQLETSNAEDLATEAIKMLKHASELSPENQEIPKALEVARKKFPKLDKI